MKTTKKLLISDMDGTLLNSKHEISDENYNAIREFISSGGLFTVATGRMTKTVFPYLSRLPVNAPAILYNGAAIYDFKKEKMLYENHLPAYESLEFIAGIINNFPDAGIEIFQGNEIYLLKENDETIKHFKRESLPSKITPLNEVPKMWYKIIIVWDPENLKKVDEYMRATGFDVKFKGLRCTYSEPQFIEILSTDCSKGSALNILTEMLGIDTANVIAIGDNLNDLEFLNEAGLGIAVDNAHPELKKNADELTVNNDNHALSSVINKHFPRGKKIKVSTIA
jgi:Cof subfamily protein (haloacid dehalogenase superfamily)